MATTSFKGIRVFDGESVLERHDVLVVDSQIRQVGPTVDVESSARQASTFWPARTRAYREFPATRTE